MEGDMDQDGAETTIVVCKIKQLIRDGAFNLPSVCSIYVVMLPYRRFCFEGTDG